LKKIFSSKLIFEDVCFLLRAVKSGDWLLIEDVHLAPSDVMSTLLPLIERGQLHVPSRGVVIKASPGELYIYTNVFCSISITIVKAKATEHRKND